MTKNYTNLTKLTLGFKNCGFIALAFTLALCASFYSSAMASSVKFNSVNALKNNTKADWFT